VFSVLLVPMVQSAALLYQWFKPSTRKEKARMSILIEILQAWQYAEVYLIAIFVASWQLGPVSEFMINSYCDSLKDTFAQMVYYGILKEEDAQCFSVQSSIEGGSFVLACGAVLLALINTFVIKAVVQYFRDNDELVRKGNNDEEKVLGSVETNSIIDADDAEIDIHPVPVLFSDTFRWLLVRNSDMISSSRALFLEPLEEHSGMHQDRGSIFEGASNEDGDVGSNSTSGDDELSSSTDESDSSSSMSSVEETGQEVSLSDTYTEGEQSESTTTATSTNATPAFGLLTRSHCPATEGRQTGAQSNTKRSSWLGTLK